MPTQDDIFAASEGDRWFQRNRDVLASFDPTHDLPLKVLDLYQVHPRAVLEVGSANGFRLAVLAERHRARAVGCEVSAEAIADGRKRFPAVEFVQGRASELGIDGPFDLIIVNFVLHWVDRSKLLRAAAEIDRVLVDGGLLLLGDFAPPNRVKTVYHHLPELPVFTYKQDYAAMFLASGLYQPVCLLTADHSERRLRVDVAESERIGTWLLRKATHETYAERPLLR